MALRSPEYKRGENEYRHGINRQKACSTQKFISDGNKEPYKLGSLYPTAPKTWCSSNTLIHWTSENKINLSSPFSCPLNSSLYWRMGTEKCPLFTVKELGETVLFITDKKAPEPDGIPSKVSELKSRPCYSAISMHFWQVEFFPPLGILRSMSE